MEFFNSAKFFNNAKNQLEFTKETRFARYQSKFSLIFGIKKKFCFVEKIFHFLSVVHTTNTHFGWDIKLSKQTYKSRLSELLKNTSKYIFILVWNTVYIFFQSLNWVSDNGDKMSFNTQSTSDMKKSLKSKQICSSAKAWLD